jgi:Rod binding domain-containing protein
MISPSHPNPMRLPPGLSSEVNRSASSPGKFSGASQTNRQPAANSKLQYAAGEFESMLLSNLWKSMKSTFTSEDSEDPASTDPAHDSLDQMGIDAMSSAVGKAGGLGLGKLILRHLEPKLPAPTGKVSPDR